MIASEEEFEEGAFRTFWYCFKRNFKRGTLLWLLVLFVLGLLVAMWYALHLMPVGLQSVYTITLYVLCFLFLLGYQYYFPLAAAHEDLSVPMIVRNSFLYAVAALPQTIGVILVTGVFFYVTVVLNMNVFRFGIFLWCACGFAIAAYLNSFFFLRIEEKFRKIGGE